MHELLLFAQIPPTQHSHLLSILAGIAAMQPQPFLERHLVFKPSRTPGSSRSGPGESSVPGMADAALHAFQTQTRGDTFYVQLVGALKGKLGGKDRGVDGKVEGTVSHDFSLPSPFFFFFGVCVSVWGCYRCGCDKRR